jgi:multidrug resistance efflux pump
VLQVKLEQAAAELSAANQKVDALSNELLELQATLEQVLYMCISYRYSFALLCFSGSAIAKYRIC